MNERLEFYLTGIAITLLIVVAIVLSAQNDKRLETKADCIAKEARAEHYWGNVYGRGAWDKYSKECNQIIK